MDDVSPTVLYALGIRQPTVWHGRPVKELFTDRQEDEMEHIAEEFNVTVPVLVGGGFLAVLACFCLYLWIWRPQDTVKDREIEFKKLVEEVEDMIDVDTGALREDNSSDTENLDLEQILGVTSELERMVR